MRTRTRQPAVLGLCSFTHDSAAALVTGGTLTGMAEEERLSGVKHTREYPAAAVQWLLDDAGLTAAGVDVVAYNFAGHRYLAGIAAAPAYLLSPVTRSSALPRAVSFAEIHRSFRHRMKRLKQIFPNGRVRCVPHHLAHGLYAHAASGFEASAVLIIDSLGETCTTSIASAVTRAGADVSYRITESVSDPASLGYAYGAVTAHLGWRRGDEEGTVMALAALGDPARFRDLFARAIPLTRTGFALDPTLFPLRVLRPGRPRVTPAFTAATCPAREPFRPFAPVLLAEYAASYFRLAQPSPFMSIAVPVTDLARDKIPAIVHANGAARVQTLAPEQNPFLADVLSHFAELTGVPVLINTSLNVKGKPICGTPQMALDCLAASGLDALMLDGGWWVSK